MKRLGLIVSLLMLLIACQHNEGMPMQDDGYTAPEPARIEFTDIEVTYSGDDIGESLSDGWVVRLMVDMQRDDLGRPVGSGHYLQLLLNGRFDATQSADTNYLVGEYTPQLNSGNFAPETFVPGYTYNIETPAERLELPDGSYYASVNPSSTAVEYDLIDEGWVRIAKDGDGFVIEGILVGERCQKHYFSWSGSFEIGTTVKPAVPNSTIDDNIRLEAFSQAQLQDRGDYFALGDNSYRSMLLFLAADGVDLQSGRPEGNGEVLRLEMLVEWDATVEEGLPAGRYLFTTRNENTSIDRENIRPYTAIPGLPDCFTYPYIAGSWYFDLEDSKWGDYARIDTGEIVVERGDDGSHTITYTLGDCSTPSHTISGTLRMDAQLRVIE